MKFESIRIVNFKYLCRLTIYYNQSKSPLSSVRKHTDWEVKNASDNQDVTRTDDEHVIESDNKDVNGTYNDFTDDDINVVS